MSLRLAALLAMSLATACGARSSLDGAGADAATSTSTSPATSSTTSVSAGGAGPCTKLTQFGLTVSPVIEPGKAGDDYIRLTAVTDDGQDVAAVFDRQEQQGGAVVLHHVAFRPWHAWPSGSSLGPVHSTLMPVSGVHFVAAAKPHRYTFAAGKFGNVEVMQDVDPNADGNGAMGPSLTGSDAEFIARQPGSGGVPSYFVGTFVPPWSIDGHIFTGNALSQFVLACASGQPPTAAAVPWKGAWLAAVSAGAPFGKCAVGTPGSPTKIQILSASTQTSASVSLAAEIATNAFEIVSVSAAPHPDGAYVVWLEVESDGSLALYAARIVMPSLTIVGPVKLAENAAAPASFAIAAMKDRLAIARATSPAGVVVSVLDESLAVVAETTAGTGGLVTPMSALGSPDGSSVIVGWRAPFDVPPRVEVARFDCR